MKFFRSISLAALVLVTPHLSYAQSLQGSLINIIYFVNDVVVPFLLGIAFLIFVINALRFYILHSDSKDGHENAKYLALYSLGAFVVILSLWGIVNILVSGLFPNLWQYEDCDNMVSDYVVPDGRPCGNNPYFLQ